MSTCKAELITLILMIPSKVIFKIVINHNHTSCDFQFSLKGFLLVANIKRFEKLLYSRHIT